MILTGALLLALAGGSPAAADARRADVAHFRERVLSKDRSYTQAARAEAEARLARLESAAGEVSQAYFDLELARIVALADNAHTACFAGPRSRRYDRVGIRLVPFGEDFFVLRARPGEADLLGARLVAIGAQPIAKLREAARSLAGGPAAWRDRTTPYLLESPEQMQALGLIAQREEALYRFETPDGRAVERRIAAEPAAPDRGPDSPGRSLYPGAGESGAEGWRSLLAAGSAPWVWREPDVPFRWREAPELEALVVELRQNTDGGGYAIGDFLEEISGRIRRLGPRHLVLDMRMNGGGDLTRTREFMESLPRLVPGRIFVLIGPWTFSAAISSVGYLRQAAPQRVTLVGEAVGDRLQFWAEGGIVELPHSGAVILIATERHDYLTGCRPFTDCHRYVRSHPIEVAGLDPDVPAPWTLQAYREGRDPAMEAAEAALRGSRAGP